MIRDRNPKHWKLWVFYYNPDEPRLLVAKRTGTPWTFNYARLAAWAITAAIVMIPVVGAFMDMVHLSR